MKDDQYNKGFRRMLQWIALCVFLLPLTLIASNNFHEVDIGAPSPMNCPTPIVVANDPGSCHALVNYTPPANAYLVMGQGPNTAFNVGVTLIQYNLNDDSDSCTFTVTVNDTEAPVFDFCPEDIIQSTYDGTCQAIYYNMPTAYDNCGIATLYQLSGLPSGSVFPIGTTLNTFVAEDEAGNTATCSFLVMINGENTYVLKTDGSSSEVLAPQGELRYQRAFYLITSDEMALSDLSPGMDISTIGFTTGLSQNSKTSGNFKLYLQNTTDIISRIDDDWITVTTTVNMLPLSGIEAGKYEWKVEAVCSGSGAESEPFAFSNDDISGCNQPFNLETTGITETEAILNWELPLGSGYDEFEVIYGDASSTDRDTIYVTELSYTLSSLTEETNYQWSVRSLCSGEQSSVSLASFTTEAPDLCDEPTGLAIDNFTDTTIKVSWVENTASASYKLAYRRQGSKMWLNAFSFSNSHTFTRLEPGTSYEWRVQTNCADGYGAYVDGPVASTSGATQCYPPEGLKVSDLSSSGVTLSWRDVPDIVSYEVSYRLKESITWDNAISGMSQVADSLITIPDTIGPYDIPFNLNAPFTYSGEGVYVAWEYSNPADPLSSANKSLSTAQNSVLKGTNGVDSLKLIKSFYARADANSSTMPEVLKATNMRPETRLGSSFLQDSVEVVAIYTMGRVALNYNSPVPLSARIRNFSDKPRTYDVTMEIFERASGNLKSSTTQSLAVPAACSELVEFADLIPQEQAKDSIVVSVPLQASENVVDNNSKYYLQDINTVFMSYADETPMLNGAGFDTGEGLILSKFSVDGCGKVNGVKIFLHHSAADNPLYAVILDANGTILDQSAQRTLDSTEVNNFYSFFFPSTPLLVNEDCYVGLAQTANPAEGYFPVGTQWEGDIVRENAYFRSALDGTGLADHPYPGRLMIQAEIIPGMPEPFISGNEILCDNTTQVLQAASKITRYANEVIAVSSEYSKSGFGSIQTLGTPDVYPDHLAHPNSWIGQSPASTEREHITLHFTDFAKINFIDIYQTLNPGAIDTVYAIDSLGNYHVMYSNSSYEEPPEASIKEIRFPLTDYRVNKIRIALYSNYKQRGIDAVAIGRIDDPATFASYSWSPGGETTPSIDVATPGAYILTVSHGASCTMKDSIIIETPTISVPTISLDGPAMFCYGDSVILTSSEPEGNLWSNGATTQSITVDTSGTYNVTYDNGCETATSADVIITSNSIPEPAITGGSICPGSSGIILAEGGYNSYEWSTGETTQSISVSIPDTYTLTVTDANGCEGTGFINSFYAAAPMPIIFGDPFFCPGDSSLLDAGSGYNNYLWSTGDTTRQIYVAASGTISVMVTNAFGCTGSTSVNTGEYTPPQPFISGALSLCYGSGTVLDASEGYASYLWSTGEITPSIVVDTADTFTVYVIDANGCVGNASATTTLDGAIPEVPGIINGPTGGICQQSGLIYTIDPVPNSIHYVWTVPEGMTIVSGQGTTEIIVDADIVSSGIISVAASNTCGQSPTWNGRTLEVHGAPDIPGEISGPANGVCGLSGLTYSVDAVYGALSYNWSLPVGVNMLSGAGSNSITVSFDPTFVSGNICVETLSACGTSEPTCLTVNSKPAMAAEILGPELVCRKQKNVAYHIDPVFNADTYHWTVPLQASIKSGQGTPDIVVDFGNKSGIVTVKTENDCGISDVQSLYVNVEMCDNGVVINSNDPDIGGTTGQDAVTGAVEHMFFPEVIASTGGFAYGKHSTLSWTIGESVIETVNDDHMMLSQGFHQSYYEVIALGGLGEGSSFDVEVYPVPTRSDVNIHLTADKEYVNLKVELFDLIGNVIYLENVKSREFNHRIDLSAHPAKVFLLKVTDLDTGFERTFKIIKVRL